MRRDERRRGGVREVRSGAAGTAKLRQGTRMVSMNSGVAPRTPATTFDGEQQSEREGRARGEIELDCGREKRGTRSYL
jgi:hypothetical protein